jgi:hypothetical protein
VFKTVIFALMHFFKAFIVVVVTGNLLLTHIAMAQMRISGKPRSVPKSKTKAAIICPIFDERRYPYQGIGVKLGDPIALTYKFYATPNLALAVDAGITASSLYNNYYRTAFVDYIPDSLEANESMQYLSHKVTRDILLEGKFLYQWSADKLSKGLHFYAGAGWQWRNTTIHYNYLFEATPPPGNRVSQSDRLLQSRYTYGPVGIIGFEYAYFSIPISAFIEIEWFSDLGVDRGYNRFQGGVGLRYVF